MNVIIGENDVGKSTILEALDIFFNDEAKIDVDDCNVLAEERVMEISASFSLEDDEEIVLDTTNPTSLKSEYLLNENNNLEIKKVLNATGKSITKSGTTIYIKALHPNTFNKPLITYKQQDLKKLLEEHKEHIPEIEKVNKTKKADIRLALFKNLIKDNTEFKELLINIKDIQEDSLKTWDKLRGQLPFYTLFKSDRANTDSDKEVQDPMKAMTKEILADLQPELERIKDEVVSRVEKLGEETIEKLGDFNKEIASELVTVPDLKSWDSLFKFNLDTDRGVPLNKRGSGVRRLILLSYFRAQAEREYITNKSKSIIYAIEEPETSQHPNYQKMVIETLLKISERDSHQVFITTHTPEIAKMVNNDSLILIEKDSAGTSYVVSEENNKIRRIANTLGILPTIQSRVVICVEGPNDVNFIQNINQAVPDFKEIIDFKTENIGIYPIGGSRLIDWINKDYFKTSGTFEFHLYDNDVEEYKKSVEEMNRQNDGRRYGVITKMREMENYVPIDLIEDYFKCDLSEYINDWASFDLPNYLKNRRELLPGVKNMNEREKNIKMIINGSLTKKITADSLRQQGVYDEIEGWFRQIRDIYDATTGRIELQGV